MNAKQFLMTAGCGALTVALLALPGSSARTPDPSSGKSASPQAGQGPGQVYEFQGPGNPTVNVFPFADDDDDVQVIVNSGQGWLGVGITEVNAEKVKELKLPAERGVLLGKIVPESPAAKAGLQESDVITEVNGQRIEGAEQFRRIIREIPAGRAAQFTIWRDGHSQTLSVTLGKSGPRHMINRVAPAAPGSFAFQMPDMPQMGEILGNGPWFSTGPRLGIDAENLDGEFGNFFGAPEGEGILVRGVFPDSPASKAGLKVGDVITSVDGERIRSVGELREKLGEKNEAKSVKLGLIRNKAALSLSVEIPAAAEKKVHHSGQRTSI
jgi:serine protease Do